MLCDAIIGAQGRELSEIYSDFEPVRHKVEAAQKFVLAPAFAAAADGLVNNYTELDRIAPFCRLPYPLCWFEAAQMDRPEFESAKIVVGDKISRVGFLAEASDRLSHWVLTLMWSMRTAHAGSPGVNASIASLIFDTEGSRAEDRARAQRHFSQQDNVKVRGHFKQRATGLFWWGPHMRGDLDKGYIAKDYEVRP